MRSTPPRLLCLCFKALSDWHYWHLGEIASCQATMAEGISLAKELIEFDPEKEGLPKEGKVYLKIQDRFFELDLKLRMLAPHELALAQGFRKGYRFVGNKTQVVKQIGNAVPRRLARAIVAAALTQKRTGIALELDRSAVRPTHASKKQYHAKKLSAIRISFYDIIVPRISMG